jgi:hypothetical protein
MNEVEALPQMMLQQVANDVMLRINDVALRANGHAFGVISQQPDCFLQSGRFLFLFLLFPFLCV